jgi:hypothetical protein
MQRMSEDSAKDVPSCFEAEKITLGLRKVSANKKGRCGNKK